MSDEVYVVAFAGDDTRALDYALALASRSGARLHIAHILEWSAYSFLTPQELEERHSRRKDELARAQEAILNPALARAAGRNVKASGEIRYGSAADLLIEIAKTQKAAGIIAGRTAATGFSARLFGSIAVALATSSPTPVTIVP